MSVYKRGSRFHVRIYVKGERKFIGTYATELDAQEAEIAAKRSRVLHLETCGEFSLRYLADYNRATKNGVARWSPTTLHHYETALKPFRRQFASVRLRDFNIAEARPWALTQPEGYVRVVSTMFADALRDGLIVQNPFSNLRIPKSTGRKNIVAITEAELELLCGIAGSEIGPTFEALVATLGYVGVRPGESYALEHGDVDVKRGTIDVRQAFAKTGELKTPKNGKARLHLLLPEQAASRIAAMPRRIDRRWLFVTKQGKHFRASSFHMRWARTVAVFEAKLPAERRERLAEARGGGRMEAYELRHAAATILLHRGASPEDCAWQLGHSGPKLIHERYGHPEDSWRLDRLRAAYAQNVTPLHAVTESDTAHG